MSYNQTIEFNPDAKPGNRLEVETCCQNCGKPAPDCIKKTKVILYFCCLACGEEFYKGQTFYEDEEVD